MQGHRTWRRSRPGALAIAALALALLAAACGGTAGAGTDGVATAGAAKDADADKASDATEKDPQQAGLDFARCMREHGVDMPDPEFGGDGFIRVGPGPAESSSGDADASAGAGAPTKPPAEFEEADKACRHILDDLVQDGGGPIDPEAQDRMLKFTQCMREHGVDMPDPEFSGGGGRFRAEVGAKGLDPSSDTFQEAQKACGTLFGPDAPGGGPRFGTGGAAVSSAKGASS